MTKQSVDGLEKRGSLDGLFEGAAGSRGTAALRSSFERIAIVCAVARRSISAATTVPDAVRRSRSTNTASASPTSDKQLVAGRRRLDSIAIVEPRSRLSDDGRIVVRDEDGVRITNHNSIW